MFHPQYNYINKVVTDYTAIPLLHDIFKDGKLVYDQPSLDEIKNSVLTTLMVYGMNISVA